MEIRDIELRDLVLLEKHATFPMKNFYDQLYIMKKSVIKDEKLIGSFFVKLTTESMLIFNESCPLTRARALKMMFDYILKEHLKLGFDDSHIFLNNLDNYGELLKKHFGFEDVIGKPLVFRKKA